MNDPLQNINTDLFLTSIVGQKHAMLLYDSMEYYRNIAFHYIRDGLENGDKCIVATDQYRPTMISEDFERHGLDKDSYIENGHLRLLDVRESYAESSKFNAEKTLKKWQKMSLEAQEKGFRNLRVLGEATFALERSGLTSDLIYYENLLNRDLFPRYPMISICVYAKNLYPSDTIKAAIKAHPMLIYNDSLYKNNIYYIPPEIYFQENSRKEIEHWLENVKKNNAAVQALDENEKKFRTIFNNTIDAFYIHTINNDDSPGPFIEVNDQACRMLGYTRDELLCMTPLDFKSNSQKDPLAMFRKVLSQGHATFETGHIAKDGAIIPVEISSYKFILNGAQTIFSVARNITDREQSNLREKKLQEQLRQLQKIEALGTLTGGIAHDFNNILSIMLGYTELSQARIPQDNPAQASLKNVKDACFRARDIVHQLLTFARRGEHEKKEMDIRLVIKEGLKMLRSTLPSSIDFQIDIPTGDFPHIRGDVVQIHQIMVNLCTNASHAMREKGGILTIRMQHLQIDHPEEFDPNITPGEFIHLSVQDTGEGISSTEIGRIFDPYFTTQNRATGSGLGLSVVQGIIKTHEGGIKVSSESGKGTTFDIFFPVMARPSSMSKNERPPEPVHGNERILFVDDEEVLTTMSRERLEQLGYTVRATTDPIQAFEWFRTDASQFDLVITDMTMPGMTGIKLSQKLHALRNDIPIILCSGFNNIISKTSWQDSGIALYLNKPMNLNKLARSIRKVLDGKSSLFCPLDSRQN